MELKDFIESVVLECVEGITLAQKKIATSELNAIVAPSIDQKLGISYNENQPGEIKDVEITVAVTSSKSSNGKLGINVVNLISGDIGESKVDSNVSTVKVVVPILYPTFDVKKKLDNL